MLLFRSEEDIDGWCATMNEPRGEAVPLDQIWELSRPWYGSRMDEDYRGRTPEEAEHIFRQAGLASDFWRVG